MIGKEIHSKKISLSQKIIEKKKKKFFTFTAFVKLILIQLIQLRSKPNLLLIETPV